MGLNKFVVYGRLVRQLVPLIILAGAFGIRWFSIHFRMGSPSSMAIVVIAALIAVYNFGYPLRITYPDDFLKKAEEMYPDFSYADEMMDYKAPDSVVIGNYRTYFVKYIYPVPTKSPEFEGELLLSAPHPQSYPPFLFEGYSPLERKIFSTTDISMRLMRIDR